MARKFIYYYVDVKHDGLNKFRRIKASKPGVALERGRAQLNIWNEQWEKKQLAERKRMERKAEQEARTRERVAVKEQREEQRHQRAKEKALLEKMQKIELKAFKKRCSDRSKARQTMIKQVLR